MARIQQDERTATAAPMKTKARRFPMPRRVIAMPAVALALAGAVVVGTAMYNPGDRCAMYAAVDCLQPGAPVLLFEPNAIEDNWPDAWFQDSPSLAGWLTAWLSGTGWWEEEVMLAEDAEDLKPWPDAARRIAVHN